MSLLSGTRSRVTGMVLVCALLAPSAAIASPKQLTPETVHARILKAGLGNFAAVQLQDGVAFGGRIVSIDDQTFSLQLHNDPEVTAVFYRDVVQLNTGISHGAFWTIFGVGIGGVVAMAVIGIHEVNKHSQLPAMPTLPTSPVFP
jgi:hypothetical protein